VGTVIAAYPTASQILLVTDPDFAAGVVTQSGVHGTLKGQGTPQCKIDYVAFEERVEAGEWVYTSGDDRMFPRGFKVGLVRTVRPSQPFREILIEPSGMQRGLEDVLIVLEGVHERIPDAPSGMQPVYMAAPPPAEENKPASTAPPTGAGTEADRLRTQYKTLGDEQKHTYGENPPGTKPVDFSKLGTQPAAQAAPVVKPEGSAPVAAPAGTQPAADGARRLNQGGGPPPGVPPANTVTPPKQSPTPAVTPAKQPAAAPPKQSGAPPGGPPR
jgi:rod shape-determining protein MreC